MKSLHRAAVVALTLVGLASRAFANDPLPSWNETGTKHAIINSVDRVTKQGSPDYVSPQDRVATFDNDGTLWCEKPLYIHLMANLDRFKELMEANPELGRREPYRAIATKNLGYFMDLYEKNELDTIVGDLFGVPFDGLPTDAYAAWQRRWLANWKHPRFHVGYRGLIYQPMVELVRYLQENAFRVYLFTADEGAFLRLVSESLYGIPPQHVQGTSIELRFTGTTLVRTSQARYLNNWDGKPRLIFETLGCRPILAAGNSNGDLQMLQYVAGGKGTRLSLVVHHTDDEREYAYDKHTEKILPAAKKGGWTVIDMKTDWNRVFAGGK